MATVDELRTSLSTRKLPYTERIGINLRAEDLNVGIRKIAMASKSGLRQVWFTSSGSMYRDTLTLLAVGGSQVKDIRLGTSIVQAYTRHPVATAQQVLAVNDVAPNRFRLGIGVSHRPIIEQQYGIEMKQPLRYLREYVASLRSLLYNGYSEFNGKHFKMNIKTGQIARVPILVAALGLKTFELAGEVSDGAISWMCPPSYLIEKASKALQSGAKRSGRETPTLVAHMMVAVTDDEDSALSAAEERVKQYARMPFYANMFRTAGYDVSNDPSAYRKLADALTIRGDPEKIGQRLKNLLGQLDELLLMQVIIKDEEKEFSMLAETVRNLS
ncbi:MAG: LLM class flavin-dependent oxidoreductase [Conexivisphaerales archaeon]